MSGTIDCYFCTPNLVLTNRGSSSFGRARPCQGRGGRFEPGLPLQKNPALNGSGFFHGSPGGGIGRHAGLKILFAATRVTVQLRSGAQSLFKILERLFYLGNVANLFAKVNQIKKQTSPKAMLRL